MPRFLYSVLSPLPFQLWPIKFELDDIGQTSVKNSIPSDVEDSNINNYIIMNHECDYYRFRPQCMCCTTRVKQFQSQRRARIASAGGAGAGWWLVHQFGLPKGAATEVVQ